MDVRFAQLRTMYQITVESMPSTNPVKVLSGQRRPSLFLRHLTRDGSWDRFLEEKSHATFDYLEPKDKKIVLRGFLTMQQRAFLDLKASDNHLTAIINPKRRGLPGLRFVDRSLNVTAERSRLVILYRKGMFNWGRKCLCGMLWTRGHETCDRLDRVYDLSRAEKKDMSRVTVKLERERRRLREGRRSVAEWGMFTEIDYLLYVGRFETVGEVLLRLYKQVTDEFYGREGGDPLTS